MAEEQDDKEGKLSDKEELEAMLADIPDSLEDLVNEAQKLTPKKSPLVFDYTLIKTSSENESSDIVDTSAEFYVSRDTIDSNEYIQKKMLADKVVLANMFRQSKIAEYSICKMLEQIEEGDMHPRTFEVLSGFQKTHLELTQAISKRVKEMEEEYKQLKTDYEEISTKEATVIDVSNGRETADGGVIQRGTRGMLEQIRNELDRKDKEERQERMEETIRRQEIENEGRRSV